MDTKSKAGDALKTFCREFGVPKNITFNSSGEQTGKNTTFMKYIKEHDINYHVTEPEFHQKNLA